MAGTAEIVRYDYSNFVLVFRRAAPQEVAIPELTRAADEFAADVTRALEGIAPGTPAPAPLVAGWQRGLLLVCYVRGRLPEPTPLDALRAAVRRTGWSLKK